MVRKFRSGTFLLIFSICNFSFIDSTLASKDLKQKFQENTYHNLLQEDLFQILIFKPSNNLIAQKNLQRFIEVGELLKKNLIEPENLQYYKELIYSVSSWTPNTSLSDEQQRVTQALYSRGISAQYVKDNSGRTVFVISVGGYSYYCFSNSENKLLCPVQEQ